MRLQWAVFPYVILFSNIFQFFFFLDFHKENLFLSEVLFFFLPFLIVATYLHKKGYAEKKISKKTAILHITLAITLAFGVAVYGLVCSTSI